MRSRYQQADRTVFRPAFVMLNISDGQSSPPFQTPITVSGRTWGVGERQKEKRREEKKRRKIEGRWRRRKMEGRWRRRKTEEEEKRKDVRGDTERRGENKGFQYWYNNQKYPPVK